MRLILSTFSPLWTERPRSRFRTLTRLGSRRRGSIVIPYHDTIRWSCSILLFGGILLGATPTASSQTTATWNFQSGLWTDAFRWSTNPFYPNNGNPPGTTYNAVVNGFIDLDRDITIEKLTFDQGLIRSTNVHTLTLNQGLDWRGGDFRSLNLILHGASSVDQFGSMRLYDTATTNHGSVAARGWIETNSGSSWINAGGSLLEIVGDLLFSPLGGNLPVFQNQSGATIRKSAGAGSSGLGFEIHNEGTIEVLSGTLFAGFYNQAATGSLTVAGDAVVWFDGSGSINGGIGGAGVIDYVGEELVHANGTITPGMSIGTLTLESGLFLSDSSLLDFELGSGGTGDRLDVFGNLVLDGVLDLSTEVDLDDGLYTLITWTGSLDDRGLILGRTPTGYDVELIVDPTLKSVLASVSVIPEPTSVLLLGGGLVAAWPLVRRRRRAG